MYLKLKILLCFLLYATLSNGQTIRKIDLKANDIVYSVQQNSLYATASASSTNKAYGNSVCRIDPTTGFGTTARWLYRKSHKWAVCIAYFGGDKLLK